MAQGPEPPRIKAWLAGDTVDLEILAGSLPGSDICIVHDADECAWYLTAPQITNPTNPGGFDEQAELLLMWMNGLAWARHDRYKRVTLTGKYTDLDGNERHVASFTLSLSPSIGMSASAVGSDHKPKANPPSPWPAYLALADSNADVAGVLEIIGSAEAPDWGELFKVHEKIQDSVGTSIPKMGWASKLDDAAFCASANRYDISGRYARHARKEKRPAPKRTMTLDQGRDYIRNLVIRWLDWLRSV